MKCLTVLTLNKETIVEYHTNTQACYTRLNDLNKRHNILTHSVTEVSKYSEIKPKTTNYSEIK